ARARKLPFSWRSPVLGGPLRPGAHLAHPVSVTNDANPTLPSLLHPDPIPRPDLDELRQSLAFAFASGVSGGLFAQALDRAPLAPSTWRPESFAPDLFLEELCGRCFRVRV